MHNRVDPVIRSCLGSLMWLSKEDSWAVSLTDSFWRGAGNQARKARKSSIGFRWGALFLPLQLASFRLFMINSMAEIVIVALNAKYIHSSLGARYLLANLGELRNRASLIEMDINHRPIEIVEAILRHDPVLVGFGVYIWNVTLVTDVLAILRRLRPDLVVVLGGPEVSCESDQPDLVDLADYVITGEADLIFYEFCRQALGGALPGTKWLPAARPDLARIQPPYGEYSDTDLRKRMVYVEASRGCPFGCEFCLSSLDRLVRLFPLAGMQTQFRQLLDRGATAFKFVDRTFNLNISVCLEILEFFRQQYRPGLWLHFEMIPDRLPAALRDKIRQFPPHSLQFEIGVQTFNPEVAARVARHQNYATIEENLRFLREQTQVHLHVDLIVGLPGESYDSIWQGFDRLVALRPHEIQVGILKRLRGAPIQRHDQEWGMVYNPRPPYELLANKCLDFNAMQQLKRFARTWDLVANSGNFIETTPLLWRRSGSPFLGFMHWTEWLYGQTGRAHSIALTRLVEFLFQFLTRKAEIEPREAATILGRDYHRRGRTDIPAGLRPFLA